MPDHDPPRPGRKWPFALHTPIRAATSTYPGPPCVPGRPLTPTDLDRDAATGR